MKASFRSLWLVVLLGLAASCSPDSPGNWEGLPVPPQSMPEPSQWMKESYEGATVKSAYYKSTFRIEENLEFYKKELFLRTDPDGSKWQALKSTPTDQYWVANMTIQEPGMVGRPKNPKRPGKAVVMIQQGNVVEIYLYRSYPPGEATPAAPAP